MLYEVITGMTDGSLRKSVKLIKRAIKLSTLSRSEVNSALLDGVHITLPWELEVFGDLAGRHPRNNFV